MIDDVPRTPDSDPAVAARPSEAAPVDACTTAIAELVRLILELTSTNTALDYTNGARVRKELEHGLGEAQQTFETLPDGLARIEALRRLDGLRTLADRQLSIAPAPSAAAIAAAQAGDSSVWLDEADEWATGRLGHGSSRPGPLRRPRSDTRPERPGARRVDPLAVDREPIERHLIQPSEAVASSWDRDTEPMALDDD
jgi:hypothetical protein